MVQEVREVTVLLDSGIPSGEEAELKEALADLGFAATARDLPTVRGPETAQMLALLLIPLHAFLSAAGSRLAAEALPKFKSGLRRILHRQPADHETPLPLVLQDTATGMKVLMERDLPDEAYEALRELDLSAFKIGPVSWDRALGRWRSAADEVAADEAAARS